MTKNESLREASQFTKEWDGSGCYIQINYNFKLGEYYMNMEASQNSYRRYEDPDIVYVGTYQGRLTQKFIREETQKAVKKPHPNKLKGGIKMEDKTYNGWKNRNTWNVSLWINNDETLYELAYLYAKDKRKEGKKIKYSNFIRYAGLTDEKTPDGIKFLSRLLDYKELDEMLNEF